jgi:hypothetical protein
VSGSAVWMPDALFAPRASPKRRMSPGISLALLARHNPGGKSVERWIQQVMDLMTEKIAVLEAGIRPRLPSRPTAASSRCLIRSGRRRHAWAAASASPSNRNRGRLSQSCCGRPTRGCTGSSLPAPASARRQSRKNCRADRSLPPGGPSAGRTWAAPAGGENRPDGGWRPRVAEAAASSLRT